MRISENQKEIRGVVSWYNYRIDKRLVYSPGETLYQIESLRNEKRFGKMVELCLKTNSYNSWESCVKLLSLISETDDCSLVHT
jgi:hypothetical protein